MAALRGLLRCRHRRLPSGPAGPFPRRPLWGLGAGRPDGDGRTLGGLGAAVAGAAGGALAWLLCQRYYEERRPRAREPSSSSSSAARPQRRPGWAPGLGGGREAAGEPGHGRVLLPIPVAAAAREATMATEGRADYEDLDLYATSREQRFRIFASLEFEGQLFMTPYDFIQSVTNDEPRRTKRWRSLSKLELNQILAETPPVWKGSSKLFRNLQDKGVISYTEYLFLLCILTKPHAGFRIAFNMFDTDGNEMVDKKEFLVLQDIFRKKNEKKERRGDEEKHAMLVSITKENVRENVEFLGSSIDYLSSKQ